MNGPRPSPELSATLIHLPVRGDHASWGYGTAVVGVPGSTEVILTLPSASSRTPWAAVDVVTGGIRVGSGMPGDLRAAVFPGPDAPDRRWWVLGVYGVGRVDRARKLRVEDVTRARIGQYPSRLFPLGDDYLAIGSTLSGNVVLMAARSGERVAAFRIPQADNPVRLVDGLIRLFAPEEGQVYDVDVSRRKVVRRHEIPVGRGARLIDGQLVYLAGRVKMIRVLGPGETPEPGVPTVVGANVRAGTVVGETVAATHLVRLDVRTLELTGWPPSRGYIRVPSTSVKVLGVDSLDNLVIATKEGFFLVNERSGDVLAQYTDPRGLAGAGMLDGHNRVALATEREPTGTLAVVTW